MYICVMKIRKDLLLVFMVFNRTGVFFVFFPRGIFSIFTLILPTGTYRDSFTMLVV